VSKCEACADGLNLGILSESLENEEKLLKVSQDRKANLIALEDISEYFGDEGEDKS
jgi:hypothetical protein